MSTLKKRIIAILLVPVIILSITFMDTKKAEAAGTITAGAVLLASVPVLVDLVIAAESSPTYQNWYELKFQPAYNNFLKETFKAVGLPSNWDLVADFISQTYGGDPIQNFRIWMAHNSNTDPSNITDDQVKQQIFNMFDNSSLNSNNDTFTMNDDLRSYILYMTEAYKSDNKMYTGYSLDLRYYNYGFFASFIQNEIKPNQDNYMYFLLNWAGTGAKGRCLKIPKANFSMVSNLRTDPYSTVLFYNNTTFERSMSSASSRIFDIATDGTYTEATFTDNDLNPENLRVMNENYSYRSTDYDPFFNNNNVNYMNNSTWVSYGKVYSSYIYGTLALFRSNQRGENPYYIDNSVYNDFSQATGDYTLNKNNTNYTTYGDITSYSNSFNNETGAYPTPSDVEKFVNEFNINIINDGPGGSGSGSGSSGSGSFVNNNNPVFNNNPNININLGLPTLSGNGSDGSVSGNGSGSSGSIFEWLGDLGTVIGDLIKHIGEALLNVVKGIGELIESITIELPTMFFDFLGAIFGWLPQEWVTLLSLSLVCMLIYGIIKIFRG